MSDRYLTCAETAQTVRKALKASFPAVKFSVKSKTYSGGASITVHWVDGPTAKQVTAITSQFEGADFDPMIDLKTPVYQTLPDGSRLHYGADFIFPERHYSAEFLAEAAVTLSAQLHRPAPAVLSTWGFEDNWSEDRENMFNRALWELEAK